MTFTANARLQLAYVMRQVGPTGVTLLPDWNVCDLAAHVVVRERRVDVLPGLGGVYGPLVRHSEAVRQRYRRLPWEQLLRMVEQGPPRWAPQRWMHVEPINTALNLLEFTIHTQDMVRAHPHLPSPVITEETAHALWKQLRLACHLLYRSCPVGVRLVRTDSAHPTSRTRDSTVINAKKLPANLYQRPHAMNHLPELPLVSVRGQVLELVLHAFGRDQGSNHPHPSQLVQVSYDGSPEALSAYRSYRRGV